LILIFHALGREIGPFKRRLTARSPLEASNLRGLRGRIGETELVALSTGVGMKRARETAARAFEVFTKPKLVIMAGVAGALDAAIAPGHLVIADKIVNWRKDNPAPESMVTIGAEPLQALEAAFRTAGLDFSTGPIMTCNRVLATGEEKRAARERSGAIAVDMESGMVAAEAAERRLPFACIRAILDAVDEELEVAEVADADGRIRPLAAAGAILRKPAFAIGLARVMRNMSRATDSLADALSAILHESD
jgi:adenosylhomocysteine nucleosidase